MFKKKKLISAEILEEIEGFTEDEQLMNYAAGHMMGGFDGMVQASILNEFNKDQTVFQLYYDDNSTEVVKVDNDSRLYSYYINFVEE